MAKKGGSSEGGPNEKGGGGGTHEGKERRKRRLQKRPATGRLKKAQDCGGVLERGKARVLTGRQSTRIG